MRRVCCEHQRCPDRPRWFLRRFRTRPWYCPQCGRLWVTQAVSAYDSSFWCWKDLTEPAQRLEPKPRYVVGSVPLAGEQTLINKEVRRGDV